MSDEEGFLSRWSRRKQEAAKPPAEPPVAPEQSPAKPEVAPKEDETAGRDPPAAEGEAKFDLSSLPPIESIDAGTDIRPFLRAGVPPELTRAALRRAWVADPAIREYIGLSENAWDFTKPGGVPGFDLSNPAVDIARVAKEVFGANLPAAADRGAPPVREDSDHELVKPASAPATGQAGAASVPPEIPPQATDRVAEQSVAETQDPDDAVQQKDGSPRRRHGSALPT